MAFVITGALVGERVRRQRGAASSNNIGKGLRDGTAATAAPADKPLHVLWDCVLCTLFTWLLLPAVGRHCPWMLWQLTRGSVFFAGGVQHLRLDVEEQQQGGAYLLIHAHGTARAARRRGRLVVLFFLLG